MSKSIKLDENYTIECDGVGVSLNYSEVKQKKDKDGNVKSYTSIDKWYYPDAFSAIDKYSKQVVEYSEDLKAVLAQMVATTALISNLKDEIKQFINSNK